MNPPDEPVGKRYTRVVSRGERVTRSVATADITPKIGQVVGICVSSPIMEVWATVIGQSRQVFMFDVGRLHPYSPREIELAGWGDPFIRPVLVTMQ